jgi:VanZ family protein
VDLLTIGWYRIVGLGLLLAATTEILQIAVPGRYFSWWDLLADALGVVLGVTLARWWLKVRRTGQG